MRWIAAVVFALMVAGMAAVAVWLFDAWQWYGRPGPATAETQILIESGSGVETIARRLKDAGIIDDPWRFRMAVRLEEAGRDLKAGEFAIPAAASPRRVIELLREGKTISHRVTLPEGRTSYEMVEILRGNETLTGDIAGVPPEGSLLPDTYHFSRGDTRQDILDRAGQAMQAALAELWEQRVADLPLQNAEEALVLASIIEKETALAEERGLVASVFVNRLRKGMKLQTDPTVIYGITEGKGPLGRSLTRSDLRTPTDYNTYTIEGLPPGPIANPGRDSLAAALNPAESDYIFFVADGTGGHAFGKTLEEHNANVKKWRAFLKEQRSKSQ